MNKNIDDWKPEVGMEVYIHPTFGNRGIPQTEKITKVGRTLFYVGENYRELKFYIDSKDQNAGQYSSTLHCYRSEEHYKRFVELQNKRREIERNIHKLTDEQVDKVYEWITSNPPQL